MNQMHIMAEARLSVHVYHKQCQTVQSLNYAKSEKLSKCTIICQSVPDWKKTAITIFQ